MLLDSWKMDPCENPQGPHSLHTSKDWRGFSWSSWNQEWQHLKIESRKNSLTRLLLLLFNCCPKLKDFLALYTLPLVSCNWNCLLLFSFSETSVSRNKISMQSGNVSINIKEKMPEFLLLLSFNYWNLHLCNLWEKIIRILHAIVALLCTHYLCAYSRVMNVYHTRVGAGNRISLVCMITSPSNTFSYDTILYGHFLIHQYSCQTKSVY